MSFSRITQLLGTSPAMHPGRLAYRPRLEALEDRLLLSRGSPFSFADESETTAEQGTDPLRVVSYNLDAGSDLTPLRTASSPDALPAAGSQVWSQVVASNIPERAATIAREILQSHPDLATLQEAAVWSVNGAVQYDFLHSLLQDLNVHHRRYMVVARSAAMVGPFRDAAGEEILLVDQNVILANANLGGQGFQFVHHRQGVLSEHSTLQLGGPQGPQLPIFSTWAAVEVAAGDHSFRIVTTRLDPFDPSVNVAQAQELATGLTQTNLPMVFTGDYSSPAGSATYGVMLGAGFHDAWMRKHAADPGATAVEPDLRDAGRSLEARTDFVFIQAGITDGDAHLLGVSSLDRTPSGLWPSNHAGLLALLVLP